MVDDTGVAQARELLAALHEQVEDISQRLETIEGRDPGTSARGAAHYQRHRNELRRELYEAHRHIDRLHRRFPETRPERRDWSSRHVAAQDRRQIGVR